MANDQAVAPRLVTVPTRSDPAEIYPDSDDLLDASEILQNGTIHTYEFDNLGRILHDRVTTLAFGVDNSVLRISTDYTADGNVATLASMGMARGISLDACISWAIFT